MQKVGSMKIFIHWLELTGLFRESDIPEILDGLNLPQSIKYFMTRKGTAVYTWDAPKEAESVYISIPAEGYSRIKLTGGYFNTFPDQSIQSLRDSMFARKGNCLRLDISLKDTDGDLNFEDFKRMSGLDHYLDYCRGSAVANRKTKKKEIPDSTNRQGVPDVHANHKLIHYGDSNSKQYAKLYRCPDGFSKFEVTLRDKAQAKTLLGFYDIADMSTFNAEAKRALVKVIDFVTPASKRAKRPVQVDAFRDFLGGEVKPIKWSTYAPEKRQKEEIETFYASSGKIIAQLRNVVSRYNLPRQDLEAKIQELEALLIFPEIIF